MSRLLVICSRWDQRFSIGTWFQQDKPSQETSISWKSITSCESSRFTNSLVDKTKDSQILWTKTFGIHKILWLEKGIPLVGKGIIGRKTWITWLRSIKIHKSSGWRTLRPGRVLCNRWNYLRFLLSVLILFFWFGISQRSLKVSWESRGPNRRFRSSITTLGKNGNWDFEVSAYSHNRSDMLFRAFWRY